MLLSKTSRTDLCGFIVFGNRLLAVDQHSLVSTDLQGQKIWEADIALPGRKTIDSSHFNHLISPHEILGWGDQVIVVSINGAVKSFARQDGQLIWSFPGWELIQGGRHSVRYNKAQHVPAPVIYKNCLLFAGERNIQRLDLSNGMALKPFEFLNDEKGQAIFTSHLAASGSTLFFTAMMESSEDTHCHAIDLDSGNLLWKQKRGRYKDSILAAGDRVILVGDPFPDDTLVIGGETVARELMVCHDSKTGIKLPMQFYGPNSAPARVLHQEGLFVSTGEALVKMDSREGKRLWKYRGRQNMRDALAVGESVVYAEDSKERIHAINGNDGSPLWICDSETIPCKTFIPSNGALFALTYRGVMVLGSPVETAQASDAGSVREEIEDIDKRIAELRMEWDKSKQLLGETRTSGDETEDSKKQREAALQKIREIGEAVPKLKERRTELAKQLE